VTDYVFTTLVSGATSTSDTDELDEAYFLRLIDKTFPAPYLEPLKAYADSGYELMRAFAAVGQRVARAVRALECGAFVIFAADAAKARTEVTFYRAAFTAGAVTIKAGARVRAPNYGVEFVVLEDAVFGATDLTVTAHVEATDTGYEWNVRGERTTATGETLAGEIREISYPLMDPPYGDPTVHVRQPNDAVGGVAPILSGVGEDRGVPRLSGEPADPYRVRARSLPDTVSPAAIRRVVEGILAPYGIAYDLIETPQITYQTAYDAPSPNAGVPTEQAVPPTSPLFDSTLFVYDDPRPEYPLRNMWLDEFEHRGAFIVVVDLKTLFDVGMAYDDPGMIPSDFRDPLTQFGRGTPAYDSTSADSTLVYGAAYDGQDLLYNAMMFGLWQILQSAKAAGVAALIERRRL